MTETITTWILVALLTEGVTEILKVLFPDKIKDKATFATSIVVGVALAFSFNLQLFNLSGVGAYFATAAAGILASRGANYLNGFLKKMDIIKTLK
ncbi:hypothetical protein KDJ56_07305 [Brevibacillus composti]|uniref:Holin n=1 Tax=Brevibacillus composti TaxID=2796470 RepID=A0A7T5EN85_9BACL|nr:hypothetical protein [Brevibacillus composti]QQE75738.1 hypothetical protein JD108_07625 [Brevibacillus composti]QUO42764.1 hypothetical protein KDJ56_07305 [Brevibacillus composti]